MGLFSCRLLTITEEEGAIFVSSKSLNVQQKCTLTTKNYSPVCRTWFSLDLSYYTNTNILFLRSNPMLFGVCFQASIVAFARRLNIKMKELCDTKTQ
jgi:hypothetical protein